MSSWKILYGFKNAGYKLQVHVTGYRVQGYKLLLVVFLICSLGFVVCGCIWLRISGFQF